MIDRNNNFIFEKVYKYKYYINLIMSYYVFDMD